MSQVVIDNGQENYSSSDSKAFNLAKVFGYVFVGLLITGIVAFGLGYLFNLWLINDFDKATIGMYSILAISGISLLILTFVIQFVFLKGKHSLYVPSIIYTILMGVLLSTMTLFIEWQTLGLAFLITAVIFAIMTLIALISKGNLNGLAITASMIVFGAGLMFLFSWLFTLFIPVVNITMYYVLNFAIFFAIMLITLWDVKRVTLICDRGNLNSNLSLYCAFTIYTDFVYIFIRIVSVVAAVKDN